MIVPPLPTDKETFALVARHFLEQMDKPGVESIEGLSPAISAGRELARV